MAVVAYPLLAKPGHLRVWVGVWPRTDVPRLRFTVDAQEQVFTAVRQMKSARAQSLLTGTPPRAFTGVFEATVSPNRPRLTVEVTDLDNDETHAFETGRLPARLPADQRDGWFNILLASCFHHQEEDRASLRWVANALHGLPLGQRPDITFLMGDQVYLDLPTLRDFKDDSRWLANKFESDYKRNWSADSGYSRLLGLAPIVAIPDDHEYWNNFPHWSPIIQNSWKEAGRKRWKVAADALHAAFQLGEPDERRGRSIIFEVAPVSFCLLDTRSMRDEGRKFVLSAQARSDLTEWLKDVKAKGMAGVVVTGQSLTAKAVGSTRGKLTDWEVPNYEDYGEIMTGIEEHLLRSGPGALLVTGDVHWGRVSRGTKAGRTALYEIIASPTSLVTTVGRDHFNVLKNRLRGIFGKRKRWPRHSDAPDAEPWLARDKLGRNYSLETLHRQRGDHVAMLSFREWSALRVEFKVSFWPVARDAAPVEIGPFQLRIDNGGRNA